MLMAELLPDEVTIKILKAVLCFLVTFRVRWQGLLALERMRGDLSPHFLGCGWE